MRMLVLAWWVGAACATGSGALRDSAVRGFDVVLRVAEPLGSFELDLTPPDAQLVRLDRGDPPFDRSGFVDVRTLDDGRMRMIGFHTTEQRPTGDVRVATIWTDTDPDDWSGEATRVYDPDGDEIAAELILVPR